MISCPECDRQISSSAAACPQCGYPNRSVAPACHACVAPATVRCQKCGKLCCVKHCRPIYVYHGRMGANQLRCDACYEDQRKSNEILSLFVFVVILGIILVMSLMAMLR